MSSFFKNCGLICILLKMFSKSNQTNVALNKMSGYCDNEPSLNKIFDGIKVLRNFESYTEPCLDVSFLFVQLGGMHAVHYCVVYEAKGNFAGNLDFFLVRLAGTGPIQICSEYPGRANLPKKLKGMRINCANRNEMYSKVLLYSRKNVGFAIMEIEVHTLGTSAEKLMIPLGCYRRFGSTTTNSALASCILNCQRKKFIFAGVKDNSECACSNELNKDDEIPTSNCDVPCPEDGIQNQCGGKDSHSVYLGISYTYISTIASVLPYYQGCLRTSSDFIRNSIISGRMTIAECLQMCEEKRYALLQFGDHCICQDSLDAKAVLYETNDCSTLCTADTQMTCGGIMSASVYATCFYENAHLPCSKLFLCQNKYNMYGDCGGVCKQGYRGDHCIERVSYGACSPTNPCLKQPNTICEKSDGKENCICKDGYTRDDDKGEECEDINECEYGPCDVRSSICANLNGSYECQCKDGFKKFTKDVCLRNATSEEEYYQLDNYLLFFFIPMISLMLTILFFYVKAPTPTDSLSTVSRQTDMGSMRSK